MDREHYQKISFNLGYITNADDDRVVIGVEFPEYPELNVQASENGFIHHFSWDSRQKNTPGDIYGRYSVRSVYCQIIDFPKGKDLGGVVLTQTRILFNDSSEMTVDIGEIHLYEHEPGKSPLKHVSSTGSSDGTSRTSYKVLEGITLVSIESPLMEKFQDRLDLEINGNNPADIVKLTLQEGNILDVTSKVGPAKDIVSEYALFDMHPKLTFMGDDRSQYSQRIYNINSLSNNYSFMDLYRYIKAREAIR